ncbi:threonine/serine ThrE exporter family protein [Lachnospira multipara]|uniref:threonine/serine ThrE exporter family protein n=1 Tax=Lachnospira multipara TaxID=28051 RepID=UPI000685B06B|nr:threonine/serine exporter family protein [Lachnospira multipara]
MAGKWEQIVKYALDLGESLYVAGGEVSRVESTVSRICYAYGAKKVDILGITSCLIVTVQTDEEVITQTRRVPGQDYDMHKLSQLNNLSRCICSSNVSLDEFRERLEKINNKEGNSLKKLAISWALVSGFFCIFFGGDAVEAVYCAVLGALLRVMYSYILSRGLNNYYAILICSFAGGLLANGPMTIGLPLNAAAISMGNIMPFVPGLAFTNSIRDMFSGETITGLLRSVESIILCLGIAFGFALCTTSSEVKSDVNAWITIFAACGGTIGITLWFNLDYKHIFMGTVCGTGGWAIVMLCTSLGLMEFLCYIIATATLTIFTEALARVYKCPVTVFLVPGIVPMVPGGLLYRTLRRAVSGDYQGFTNLGVRTVLISFGIAAGVIIVTAIADVITRRLDEKGLTKRFIMKRDR